MNLYLDRKGIRISTGTIVDATIIPAPSSTKNEKKARYPRMHQTKKRNPYYFGAKAHIGVDSKDISSGTVLAEQPFAKRIGIEVEESNSHRHHRSP